MLSIQIFLFLFADGCTAYPTFLNRGSENCVVTCPCKSIGVVYGSVNDATTDRLRVCEPCKCKII